MPNLSMGTSNTAFAQHVRATDFEPPILMQSDVWSILNCLLRPRLINVCLSWLSTRDQYISVPRDPGKYTDTEPTASPQHLCTLCLILMGTAQHTATHTVCPAHSLITNANDKSSYILVASGHTKAVSYHQDSRCVVEEEKILYSHSLQWGNSAKRRW